MVHPSKILLNGIPLDQLQNFGIGRRRRHHNRESVIKEVKRLKSEIRCISDRSARSLASSPRAYSESTPRESHFSTNSGLIYISNVHFDVKDGDLFAIFNSFGQLIRAANNYDMDGHSNGTAMIVFAQREHAVKAYNSLNGELLKGQNLCMRLISHNQTNQRQRHFWADRAENLDRDDEVFCYPTKSDSE